MKKQFEQPTISVHAIVTENVLLEIGDVNFWGVKDSGDINNILED